MDRSSARVYAYPYTLGQSRHFVLRRDQTERDDKINPDRATGVAGNSS